MPGDVAYTCETAGHFYLYQVLSRWEQYTSKVKPLSKKVSYTYMYMYTVHVQYMYILHMYTCIHLHVHVLDILYRAKFLKCKIFCIFEDQPPTSTIWHYTVQYASKKTSHKRTVQRGARSRSAPVRAPCSSRSSPVRYNWLSHSCFCAVCPFFCTAEFLARAKLKSKAKKTTEKLGCTCTCTCILRVSIVHVSVLHMYMYIHIERICVVFHVLLWDVIPCSLREWWPSRSCSPSTATSPTLLNLSSQDTASMTTGTLPRYMYNIICAIIRIYSGHCDIAHVQYITRCLANCYIHVDEKCRRKEEASKVKQT